MTDLAALVVRMQADNSQYVAALNQATTRLAKFQKDQEDMLGDLAEKFASAFTIDKIVEFSLGAIEAQDALAKFSQEAGVSVTTLSAMQIAFAAGGVSSDDLGSSLKKLNQAASEAAGDPTSKAAIAFKLLGVSVQDANGKMKDAAALQADIADAYSKLADGPNKVAIQTALMGKNSLAAIPMLNQGAAALKAMEQAAIDCGAALGPDAAAAAKELQDKLSGLAATSKAQLQNAIAAELVPALNSMIEAFGTAKDRGAAFAVIADEIVTGFKVVATIGLEVARTFEDIGDGLGSLGAQAVALVHGRFAEVNQIAADNGAQTLARDKKFADAEAALWNSSAQAQVDAAKRGATGAAEAGAGGTSGKPQAGNLEAAVKSAEADKALEKFSASLKAQSQAFGLGSEGAAAFKLQVGELADQLKIAGPAGQAAAKAALAYAHALQIKQDTKAGDDLIAQLLEQRDTMDQSATAAFNYKINTGTLGEALDRLAASGRNLRPALMAAFDVKLVAEDTKAVQKISDELDKMQGKLVDAAKHAFDLQNKGLTDNLTQTGDQAGLAKVNEMRDATVAEAAFGEEVKKANVIQQQTAIIEAQINAERAQGKITDLQAQQQLSAQQQNELTQLQAVYAAEKKIADESKIPELIQQYQQLGSQMTELGTQVTAMTNQVRQGMESAFADNFSKLINGTESWRKALQSFFKDLENQLDSMVSKDIAQQIFGTGGPAGGAPSLIGSLLGGGLGGSNSTSGGGGLLGGLSGLFGGGTSGIATTGAAAAGDTSDIASSIPLDLPAFASGGDIPAGKYGIVGENGPELAYSGKNSSMQIIPASAGKSPAITNHFTLQAPGGTITRQSQSQAAAAVARTLQQASRRNN